MKLLNKDIKGIILSNLTKNDIQLLLKSTKCLAMMRLLIVPCANEEDYKVYHKGRYFILKSNLIKKEYNIPIPTPPSRDSRTAPSWRRSP